VGGPKAPATPSFNLVHDVAVDTKGRVYVADRLNERIQVFDDKGSFLTQWSGIGAPWGIYYVAQRGSHLHVRRQNTIASSSSTSKGQVLGVLSSWGKAPGQSSITLTASRWIPPDGSIYTAEIKNWRVQKWIR